jgi:hypothetical protein
MATLLANSKQTSLEYDEAVWAHLNKEIEGSAIPNDRGKLISISTTKVKLKKKSRTIFYSSIFISLGTVDIISYY